MSLGLGGQPNKIVELCLYMNSADTFQLLRLFQKVAPAWFFHSLSRKHGYVFREGVYSAAVVIWLMIWQRLQGNRI